MTECWHDSWLTTDAIHSWQLTRFLTYSWRNAILTVDVIIDWQVKYFWLTADMSYGTYHMTLDISQLQTDTHSLILTSAAYHMTLEICPSHCRLTCVTSNLSLRTSHLTLGTWHLLVDVWHIKPAFSDLILDALFLILNAWRVILFKCATLLWWFCAVDKK